MESNSLQLDVGVALKYLSIVKGTLLNSDKPEKYNQFLGIMHDFQGQDCNTEEVIQRISKLFHGHPELLSGFNTFLPLGHTIEPAADPHGDIIISKPMGTISQPPDGSKNLENFSSLRPDIPYVPDVPAGTRTSTIQHDAVASVGKEDANAGNSHGKL